MVWMPEPQTSTAHTLHSALYDKGATIQRAGWQLPGDRLGWLHKEQ